MPVYISLTVNCKSMTSLTGVWIAECEVMTQIGLDSLDPGFKKGYWLSLQNVPLLLLLVTWLTQLSPMAFRRFSTTRQSAIDDFRSSASRCAEADWCWMFTYQQDQSGIISLAVVAMLPIFACIFADVDLHNLSDKSLCTYVCPDL